MRERLNLQNLEFHTNVLGKDVVQEERCMPLDRVPSARLGGLRNTPQFVFREAMILNGKTDKSESKKRETAVLIRTDRIGVKPSRKAPSGNLAELATEALAFPTYTYFYFLATPWDWM